MKKWLRRFAIYMAGFWAVAAAVSLYSIYLARSTPEWYAPQRPGDAEESDLANQSVQTAADLFSYAGDVAAAQRRAFLNGIPANSIAPRTFTLTQSQLNAVLSRCLSKPGDFDRELGRYISEPRVALRNGSFIIAGQVHDMGMISNSIVSVEIRPELDEQGNLWPRLAHIYSGRLPVPLKLLDKPRKNIEIQLADALPEWQLAAGLGADGLGNQPAATAVAAGVLLAGLADRSANAVVLLPCAVGDMRKTVPLKITELTIADRSMTFTLSPLTQSDVRSLRNQLSPQADQH